MDPLGLQSTSGDGGITLPDIGDTLFAAGGALYAAFSGPIDSAIAHAFGQTGSFGSPTHIGGTFQHGGSPASGFISRLTNGPWGGGISGVFSNLLDAHTYGLPYIQALAGTDYITAAGIGTANIAGQVIAAYLTEGQSVEAEAPLIITIIGREPDIAGFAGTPGIDTWIDSGLPVYGRTPSWAENQAWLQERIDRGDSFYLATPESEISPKFVADVPNGHFTWKELQFLRQLGIPVQPVFSR